MLTSIPNPFDGCHLWRLDLDAPLEPARLATLSCAEHARAARFVFERDRLRYQAAHVGLRELIAREGALGDPRALTFAQGEHGKPELVGPHGMHFNLSHSGRTGLVALADCPVGVDVEEYRALPDAHNLAAAHFSASECSALRQYEAGAAQDLAFLHGWTRKEACLKAIGAGLTQDTRAFEVGVEPGRQDLVHGSAPGDTYRLQLASMALDDEAVVAVALVRATAALARSSTGSRLGARA